MRRRRQVRNAFIIALILVLHLVGLWYLATSSRATARRLDGRGLEIVILARTPSMQNKPANDESGLSKRWRSRSPRRAGSEAQETLPTQQQDDAVHAPIDWAAELSQTAKSATDKPEQPGRDFGFPHLPVAEPKAPPLAWDYAATHRVEHIAGGGLILHLDDRCVLVLFPLPMVGCGIGEKPANGELFKHLSEKAAASTPQ